MLWWLGLYVLQVVLLCYIALRDVRRPVQAMSWMVIGLCVPVIGVLVYLIMCQPLGVKRSAITRPNTTRQADDIPGTAQTVSNTVQGIDKVVHYMTGTHPVPVAMRVFHGGSATYEALINALSKAHTSIDMEYYIFRFDHIGRRIISVLCDKADSGVRIRFLRDGLGSRALPKEVISEMQRHGIECRTFFPFRFPWLTAKLNHRDHCKIVTIDDEVAFTGGINVGDEYTGRKPGVGPWRDTHLQCVGKEAVELLQGVFDVNWSIATKEKKPGRVRERHPAAPKAAPLWPQASGEWGRDMAAQNIKLGEWVEAGVQTIESGPDRPSESIRNLFFACLTQAETVVEITTPYFVPDTDVLTAIKTALRKRVKVRLLIPEHPDHKAVGYASRTFYEELLESGVEVHLYTKGVLHAKVMTVDHQVCVLGAANYDLRSFRVNYEVCQVIYSEALAEKLHRQFERDLQHATRLTKDWLERRSFTERGMERVCRLFAPLL